MKTSCPICGSFDLVPKEVSKRISAPWGDPIEYVAHWHKCNVCGEAGPFGNNNDEFAKAAIETAQKKKLIELLEWFEENKIPLAYIERALGLPQRTISRWKTTSQISTPGFMLLHLVKMLPWLLKIGENRYSSRSIYIEVTKAAKKLEIERLRSPFINQGQFKPAVQFENRSPTFTSFMV